MYCAYIFFKILNRDYKNLYLIITKTLYITSFIFKGGPAEIPIVDHHQQLTENVKYV